MNDLKDDRLAELTPPNLRSIIVRGVFFFPIVVLVNYLASFWVTGIANPPLAIGYSALMVFLAYIGACWKLLGRRSVSLGQIMIGITLFAIFLAGVRYGDVLKQRRSKSYQQLEVFLEGFGKQASVGSDGSATFIVEDQVFNNEDLKSVLEAVDRNGEAHLHYLALHTPNMNDESLEIVGKQPKMKFLVIDGSYFSEQGIEQFRRVNSRCDVNTNSVVPKPKPGSITTP